VNRCGRALECAAELPARSQLASDRRSKLELPEARVVAESDTQRARGIKSHRARPVSPHRRKAVTVALLERKLVSAWKVRAALPGTRECIGSEQAHRSARHLIDHRAEVRCDLQQPLPRSALGHPRPLSDYRGRSQPTGPCCASRRCVRRQCSSPDRPRRLALVQVWTRVAPSHPDSSSLGEECHSDQRAIRSAEGAEARPRLSWREQRAGEVQAQEARLASSRRGERGRL
jgi:hypothetical protein